MTTSSVFKAETCSRLISSALAVTLAGAFSGTPALAVSAAGQNAPQPPASVEPMSRAALTKTVAYQKQFDLQCSSDLCTATIPPPGTGNQLTLRRISCFMEGSAGSEFGEGFITLFAPGPNYVLAQTFSVETSSSNGFHVVNSAVDIFARNNQLLQIRLLLATGNWETAICTVVGTLGPIS